jgi:hypothetical protein
MRILIIKNASMADLKDVMSSYDLRIVDHRESIADAVDSWFSSDEDEQGCTEIDCEHVSTTIH